MVPSTAVEKKRRRKAERQTLALPSGELVTPKQATGWSGVIWTPSLRLVEKISWLYDNTGGVL